MSGPQAGKQRTAGKQKFGRALAAIGGSVLLLVFAVLLASVSVQPPSPLAAADQFFESLTLRFFAPPRPPSEQIVLIGITEETLARFPYRSPLDRGFLARLIGELAACQPKVIGLDILFDRPTEPDKDAALRQAIDAAPVPVVLASAAKDTPLPTEQRNFLEEFLRGRHHGYANLARGRLDDTIRLYVPHDDAGEASLAAAMAMASGLPGPDGAFRIAWRRAEGGKSRFPVYPAQLAAAMPESWLRGKFVLVGSLVPGEDEHRTPIDILSRTRYGVEIHAQALAQILEHDMAEEPGWLLPRTATGAAAAAGMALAAFGGNIILVTGLTVLLAVIWAGAVALFTVGGPLLPPMAPTLALFIGLGGIRLWRDWRERRERRMLHLLFARFVSESVVQELWQQRDVLLAGGRPRPQELEATVLISDIAGFTPICEKLPPEPLIAWLDAYIDTMVRIVFAHEGIVLRFIGDGILAVFGAPVARGSEAGIDADARNAVQCALSMAAAMRALNEQWREQGLPQAGLRIGIHTGPLVAGSLGSGEHMEYCLLGDTPNTAARLEALGKAHARTADDCVILIGEPTRMRLGEAPEAEQIGVVTLRGKTKAVPVYRVCDPTSNSNFDPSFGNGLDSRGASFETPPRGGSSG